jgi:hypothetical protein
VGGICPGLTLPLRFAEICKAFPLLATSGKTDKEKAECILVEGLGEAARGRIWQLGQSSAFLGPRALIEVGKVRGGGGPAARD